MEIIDARGLACPQPVIETKKAVDRGLRELTVWIDNEVAAANVARFLEGQGYAVKRHNGDSTIALEAARAKGAEGGGQSGGGQYSLLFTSDKIGADSDGLGEVLMKSYIGTLVQKEKPPVAIGLMNEGVKMALRESSLCNALLDLADRGVTILVCGTCTKHFGITDKVAVGVVSNMFEITEAVFGAAKPIVIG